MAKPHPPPQLVAIQDCKDTYARKVVIPSKQAQLVESIQTKGILEPIQLSARGVVLSGNCRLAAARNLSMTHVPAVVHPDIVTEDQELAFLLAADVKSDRSTLETAMLLNDFRTRRDLTWGDAASALGVSPATASRMKTLVESHPQVLEAYSAGKVSLLNVIELNSAKDPTKFLVAAETLGAAELRKLIRPKPARKAKPITVEINGLVLTIPADMTGEQVVEVLRVRLFAAISKASIAGVNLDSLPLILASNKGAK